MKTKRPLAKFWSAKIAFKIPAKYRRVTNSSYPGQRGIPDKIISGLMDLFDDVEFVSEDICNPDLLVVGVSGSLDSGLIESMQTKINNFLETV